MRSAPNQTSGRKAQQKENLCTLYRGSWSDFLPVGLAESLKGNTYGPIMDIAMGICGAVAGGLLMQSAGFSGYKGIILTTLVAMIGAVVVTLLAGFVNGRRMYARQL